MNFPPGFLREPPVKAFKAAINHPAALEFLFNLVERCQLGKTTRLHIPTEYISSTLDLPDTVDPKMAKAALIKCGLITVLPEGAPDWFEIDVFTRNNGQLIGCWENGKKGGRSRSPELVKDKSPLAEQKLSPSTANDCDVPF